MSHKKGQRANSFPRILLQCSRVAHVTFPSLWLVESPGQCSQPLPVMQSSTKPRHFSTERIVKLVRGWYSVEYQNDSSIFNHLKSEKVNKNIRPSANNSKGLAKIKLRSSVTPTCI